MSGKALKRQSSKVFVVGDLDPDRFNRISYLARVSISPLRPLAFNFRFNQVSFVQDFLWHFSLYPLYNFIQLIIAMSLDLIHMDLLTNGLSV